MKAKTKKKIAIAFVLLGVLVSIFGTWMYQYVYSPNVLIPYKTENGKKMARDSVFFLIPEGVEFKTLRERLYKERILHDQKSFAFVAKVMGYQEKVKPGYFLFRTNMSNLDAVRMLRSPKRHITKVTFNNITYKEELAPILTKNVLAREEKFLDLLNNDSICKSYGFDTVTIACMFIPNTYEVYRDSYSLNLFQKMNREYNAFWTAERRKKAEALGLTPVEVSILASIVQKETQKNDEKQRVAGVYVNRLKKGMLLQADPTVKYAVGDLTIKRVLNKHLEYDSPYNTYKYAGLPPGPICLPSPTSLNAVLNKEDHDYLYFCAKEDFSGYHSFAKTLYQHNCNARLYRKALDKAGIR